MSTELRKSLEKNNWNENGSEFHVFNNQTELDYYLDRNSQDNNWREEYGRFDFEQCIFNFKVEFWAKKFDEIVDFKNSTFNHDVSFQNCVFEKNINFDGCHFKGTANFTNAKFNDYFYAPVAFDKYANFSSAKFKNHVLFNLCYFNSNARFSKVIFNGGADFSSVTFNKDFSINDSIIKDNISFEATDFNGKINGWNLTCHKGISFIWANFRSKINLSELKVENGNANFHGANFEKNAYFYKSIISNLDLTQSVIDKSIFFLHSKIGSANRETWRIIKHEFIKQNNKIESLPYHTLEMKEYEKEIFGDKKIYKYSLIRFIRDICLIFKKNNRTDKFILFINRISNGYNSNPFRAVKFTLSATLIAYIVIVYTIKLETGIDFDYSYKHLGLNFKQGLQLINITNWNYKPFGLKYNWSYGILFLSRIIIGFGIYQTIQAFRKYGKA